jgi:flagellar biosynthetic protein FliR
MINQQLLTLLSEQSLVFFILLARFITTFASITIFRREFVPPRILILLSMTLSLFVLMYSVLGHNLVVIPTDKLFLNLVLQMFLGFITGMIINLFVDVFLGVGQIISIQSGLGFVNLFIPRVGSITPLSQFFFITATVIFFGLNAHLLLIKMMIGSFKTHFLGIKHFDWDVIKQILLFAKIIFSGSLMLSLAVIIALLISNLTLAIMTKFSPQLNIFSLGITISLITGFFVLYICFDAITENGKILLNDILYFCTVMIKS